MGSSEIDLDALLAIDAARTPGEWFAEDNYLHVAGATSAPNQSFVRCLADEDAAAIVSAVNNLASLVERCRRAEALQREAEQHRDVVENENETLRRQIADLTRQRDELLAALERMSNDTPWHEPNWFIRTARETIASVKGWADGT